MSIEIEITKLDALKALKAAPQRMVAGIAAGMEKANAFVVSDIQARRMTGKGPFPVEENRLGIGDNPGGRLRASLRATKPVIDGMTVTSSIGSNVVYARIHEFGGVIHRPAKETTVRLRLNKKGELERQAKYPGLAVFASKHHKRVRSVSATVGAYDINIPPRAPVRTGIHENAPTYARMIQESVAASLAEPAT